MTLLLRWKALLATCVLTAVLATRCFAGEKTALDKYVAKPDPNYSYKLVNTLRGDGATAYVLEMVSQKWLTEKEVDRPIWKHWLTIIKPDEVSSKTGLLFITGGGNDRP